MHDHITNSDLQDLIEEFMRENPYGDTLDLALYMYNHGFEAGEQGGLDETNFAV